VPEQKDGCRGCTWRKVIAMSKHYQQYQVHGPPRAEFFARRERARRRRAASDRYHRARAVLHPNAEHAGSFAPRQHGTNFEAVQLTQQEHPEPQWLVDTTPPTSPHAV